ncbi:MAG: TetR/AcrR family transcriptional regulator [Clostridia bacterium]|jgi:AcrR family transcriptional regulator|nr:TetR/AcrR family transcriptional regulator [Clostridia bacterium]
MEERIIRSTLNLIGQYGFRKFTLDDVSAELGISKKTLYKYFSGKQQLITETIAWFLREDKQKTLQAIAQETTWAAKILAMVNTSFTLPMKQLAELRQFYPEVWQQVDALQEFKIKLFYDLLLEGSRKGELNPAIDLEIVAPMLKAFMDRLLQIEYLQKNDITMRQLLEQLSEVFFNGILVR